MDRTTTRNPNTRTNDTTAYTERKITEIKVIIIATIIVAVIFFGIGIVQKAEACAFGMAAMAITAWAFSWKKAVSEGREAEFVATTQANSRRFVRFVIRLLVTAIGVTVVLSIVLIWLSLLVKGNDAFASYPAISRAAGYVLQELESFLGSYMH